MGGSYYFSFPVLSFIIFTAAIIVIPVTRVIQPIICLTIHRPSITIRIIIIFTTIIIIIIMVVMLILNKVYF